MISYTYNITVVTDWGYTDLSSSTYDRYVFFEDEDGSAWRMILSSLDDIESTGVFGGTFSFESASKIYVNWDEMLP